MKRWVILSVAVLAVIAGCEKVGHSSTPRASATKQLGQDYVPADWTERDMNAFSFKAPKGLVGGPRVGIDSYGGEFQSEPFAIWFDYGMHSGDITDKDARNPDSASRRRLSTGPLTVSGLRS